MNEAESGDRSAKQGRLKMIENLTLEITERVPPTSDKSWIYRAHQTQRGGD